RDVAGAADKLAENRAGAFSQRGARRSVRRRAALFARKLRGGEMGQAASARKLSCAMPPRGKGSSPAPAQACAGDPLASGRWLEDGKKKRRVKISPELQDFSV